MKADKVSAPYDSGIACPKCRNKMQCWIEWTDPRGKVVEYAACVGCGHKNRFAPRPPAPDQIPLSESPKVPPVVPNIISNLK